MAKQKKISWKIQFTPKQVSSIAMGLTTIGTLFTLIFYTELGTRAYLSICNRDLQRGINGLFYANHKYKTVEKPNQIRGKSGLSYNIISPVNHKKEFNAMEKCIKDLYGGDPSVFNYKIGLIALLQISGDKTDSLNVDFGERPIKFIESNPIELHEKYLKFEENHPSIDKMFIDGHRVSEESKLTIRLERKINRYIVVISSIVILCGCFMNIRAINKQAIK